MGIRPSDHDALAEKRIPFAMAEPGARLQNSRVPPMEPYMISPWPRRVSCVAALLAATATAGAQSKRPMTITDIMELKNVGGVALSPDGSKIAYAVSGWEHPSAGPSPGLTPAD